MGHNSRPGHCWRTNFSAPERLIMEATDTQTSPTCERRKFMRISCVFLALTMLALPGAQAGTEGLAGNWKVVVFEEGQQMPLWLLQLQAKDGKLTGTVLPLRN